MILWHAHQNDIGAVRKLLEEDGSLVHARDYDNRTPLHVASLHGWIDIAKCLLESGADVNAQDRWKNTGQSGSHFEPKPVQPPLPNKCDWEIDPSELDFCSSNIIGKGSFGEILKASWRGTPVAVKRILPSLSDDKLVIQDFRHEVKVLVKLRHPNVVQFLGAVTDKKPLMLITEYLRGGDLHQHLKEKGDFGLSKLIKVQNCHDVYKMTGETGSYHYMAPELFKHRKYDKKVDVFSFAMIRYEMLEGDPPFSNYDPYEAAKYAAAGHRPPFRSKSYIPELRDLTEILGC
ncbi:Emp24/gp25L/p24 family/GOLD family protein [Hibiscus syriacus]|uniref:Emp24/gp25L/p24 family/GOLD family protein n=1 Tax=Hibiscus syriacus TaxID=106335 RepID=A0A6A3D0D2_HIBSY|nr:Emp24/gp25L/p24 family/GOLD family protein [Hibiscus syriacus]